MRYIISDSVQYEGGRYRFAYDTKYKHFALVQRRRGPVWVNEKYVDSNFYVLFPGHIAKTRNSNQLPNWK